MNKIPLFAEFPPSKNGVIFPFPEGTTVEEAIEHTRQAQGWELNPCTKFGKEGYLDKKSLRFFVFTDSDGVCFLINDLVKK